MKNIIEQIEETLKLVEEVAPGWWLKMGQEQRAAYLLKHKDSPLKAFYHSPIQHAGGRTSATRGHAPTAGYTPKQGVSQDQVAAAQKAVKAAEDAYAAVYKLPDDKEGNRHAAIMKAQKALGAAQDRRSSIARAHT